MKFGAVSEEHLPFIDFSLPKEPESNDLILTGKRKEDPKVYIGAAVWGDSSWSGKVYPTRTAATNFRKLYVQQFDAIELNATHYTIYSPDVLEKWTTGAREGFKFCPKFPQQISHHSNFQNVTDLTDEFLTGIRALGVHLGPVFLQLSEFTSTINRANLFAYLAELPKDINFFLELRHPEWFSPELDKEVFQLLHRLGIGPVITDTPGRRDVVHKHLTTPKAMLRFVCNALHPTSFSRTDEWVKQIQSWIERGLEEMYVILHPGNDAAVPELADYWIKEINKHCRLNIKPPQPVQQYLF
jgi:uncharacterized protein YecE (DUF72 family)